MLDSGAVYYEGKPDLSESERLVLSLSFSVGCEDYCAYIIDELNDKYKKMKNEWVATKIWGVISHSDNLYIDGFEWSELENKILSAKKEEIRNLIYYFWCCLWQSRAYKTINELQFIHDQLLADEKKETKDVEDLLSKLKYHFTWRKSSTT